ncbi:MAG: energy transducer TonB [Acidobacteriota bacterium]
MARSYPAAYPRAAREARLGGTAIVRVLVSETGRPLRLEALRGPRPLTEAAIASIRRWTFEPARKNGHAVEAWTVIEVPFQP